MMQNFSSLKRIKLRILLIAGHFVFFLGILLLRAYQLQIADNSRLTHLASQQYRAILPVQPKRGAIYDRHGRVLAMDVQVNSIAVHPHLVQNPEDLVLKLAPVVGVSPNILRAKLASNRKFEWLARRVPPETGEAVGKLELKAVSVVPEYRRYYPNRELAGNLLGAVGYDAKALGGLELAYDRYLKTQVQSVVAEKDARGRLYTPYVGEEIRHDVYLTLDVNLQFIAEKYLWENARKYGVKSGFAIVMNPKTGEVLAMANYPRFNPNVYWKYPPDQWKNHAALDAFEPGSTFKTFVASAALESGKAKPSDLFFCENGRYKIGRHTIHDHHGYGGLTVSDIIKFSSNIGVTKIAKKVGKETQYQNILALGFGKPSDLGLPGEAGGFLVPAKRWSDIEQSNIAFGQGISVTGPQMAQAYATIANQGVRMKPFLVEKIVDSQGEAVMENKPTVVGRIVRPEVAKNVTAMLQGVTEEGGTGKLASLDGYPIAGKTGTAQKVDPVKKRYASGRFVSSFIGFIPADAPKFVIYVVYDTPQSQYYGGIVAAPVFRDIARDSLAYKGVAPMQVASKERGGESE